LLIKPPLSCHQTERTPAAQDENRGLRSFEVLRHQVDRLFHDFQTRFLRTLPYLPIESFWRRDLRFNVTPAIDLVEKAKALEVTAELPHRDAKNIALQLSGGMLTIKGENQEDKTTDRYVSGRRYGSFHRSLHIPGNVDTENVKMNLKGALTVTLPKSQEAEKKRTIPTSVG
jgi:HSP20 family protein